MLISLNKTYPLEQSVNVDISVYKPMIGLVGGSCALKQQRFHEHDITVYTDDFAHLP
jgi:hypothetical protein